MCRSRGLKIINSFAAGHGNGRTATLREIEEHCQSSGAIRLLEKFKESAKEGLSRLLLAFYFRQSAAIRTSLASTSLDGAIWPDGRRVRGRDEKGELVFEEEAHEEDEGGSE